MDKDFLEEDLNTISRINELVKHIIYPHQVIFVLIYLKYVVYGFN
jgi:hypothetical protein